MDMTSFIIGMQAGKKSAGSGGGSSEGDYSDVHFVTFMSEDGTTELYKRPVADGDDCADPVDRGLIDEPTKESTAQYAYAFAGWATEANGGLNSSALSAVTEDKTVYANFAAVLRYYTITYYDEDKTTVLKTESLAYGATPATYIPEKDGYSFVGWNTEVVTVTGNADYIAQWQEAITFASGSWADIAAISEAGEASNYFKVGDTRQINLGNLGVITVAIAGFDHDDLADGSGKAGMSIVCMTMPNTLCAWAANTNAAYYPQCDSFIRYLMATNMSESVYYNLPATLKSVIKTVSKEVDGQTSSGEDPTINTVDQDLWYLSLYELGYTVTSKYISKLRNKYDLFTNSTSSAPSATVTETGTNGAYFTRTRFRVGTIGYHCVTNSGSITSFNGNYLTTTKGYLRFGFCI